MKIGKFKKIAAIGLALTMAIGLLYTGSTVNAVDNNSPDATTTNDVEGLELNKTAVYDEKTGKYKITLDAFTTGDVTTETSSKPLDIVLVLDQSGSMDDLFTVSTDVETVYNKWKGLWVILAYVKTFPCMYLNSSPLYYLDPDDNQYYVVSVEATGGLFDRHYYVSYEKNGETINLEDGNFWQSTKYDYYTREQSSSTTSTKKINALKDSVKSFINEVRADDVRHNVAIVGFASKTGYGNNTEVLSIDGDNSSYGGTDNTVGKRYRELTPEDYRNALVSSDDPILDHAIDALAANGATRADLGMEMAETILSSTKDPNRQQVVIMFTDGEPTSGSSFETEVANAAISSSKTMKDSGAKVYTIGIFNGANPDDTRNESNIFMNYTSTNYPYATDMYNAGQRGSGNYYFAASDADQLTDVFEQISEDISKPTLELGSNAIIKDSMSDYFDLIVNDNQYPITIQKLKYTGMENNNYTFDESKPENVEVTTNPTKDGISVSGFDFDTNYVRTENGVDKGYKLRITFYAEPIDGFIGGLSVPTNGADSGLYEDSSATTPLESFEIPTVDVDLNYDFDVTNQGMYVGNDWDDVQKFLNATDDGVAYKIGDGLYNTNNDFVNDFVNIIYTIKIKQKDENNQDIYVNFGTYTVENGKPTGTLSLNESFDAKDFRDTQEFVVSVDVINKKDQQQSSTDNKDTQIKSIGGDKNANLYIFVPTIETKDSNIDLGKEDILNQHLTEKGWLCTENASISESEFKMGDRPNLVFEYISANNENSDNIVENTFTPDIVGQHEFYVTVTNSITGEEITDATVFNHKTDICETDPCNKNHFYVTVVGGSITILKQIDESSTIDLSKGEPTFTFKVEQKDGDSYKTIGYKTIHMKNINDQWIQNEEIIFNGLSAGEYRITELKTMRFDVESVYKGRYGGENLGNSESVIIEIGGLNNNDITLTYKNKVKSSSYESDGSGLINKFESDGGKITVRPERLYDNVTE